MAISMEAIKELRAATGVSISECKKALEAANGDVDMAIDELRKRGAVKAAKRAENDTNEGTIKIEVDGGNAYVSAMTSETDFVAKNEDFHAIVVEMNSILKEEGSADAAATRLEELKESTILKLGENMRIKESAVISGDAFGQYIHGNGKVAALVVGTADADEEKLRNVAMHVVANNPQAFSVDSLDPEVLAKEKALQLEMMQQDPKNEGKPAELLEKIIDGKMNKFAKDQCLLSQAFVMNPDQTVEEYMGAGNTVAFYRYAI